MKIKCAHCGKDTTWENNEFRPFCSERCKMLDFGSWIDEEYKVPDEKEDAQNYDEQRILAEVDDEIADEIRKQRGV